MKKLLAALLLIPSMAFATAESVTSGAMGLLKLSTDTRSSRNWGAVNNANLDIIASTMNTALNTLSGQTLIFYDEGKVMLQFTCIRKSIVSVMNTF